MRRALPLVLLPLTLLLSGCCVWWDDDEEVPYHEVRVHNHTDRTVTIRYTAVIHVFSDTDDDGDTTYTHRTAKRSSDIPASGHQDIRVERTTLITIKADYEHLIHEFTADADSLCPCDVMIDMRIEDFVPSVAPANG